MMKRICMPILSFAIAAALLLSSSTAAAQSDNKNSDRSKSTSASTQSFNDNDKPEPVFEKRGDERLYRRVLAKLEDMEFAKDSDFIDEKTNDKIDWFIVGGSFLDRRSGELQANFATMQGADSVARKIVEFEAMDHGRGVKASWKVFNRYGGEGEATNALRELEVEFEDYRKARIANIRRQQAASRARSRRGSC